jgi:hypothetical protein
MQNKANILNVFSELFVLRNVNVIMSNRPVTSRRP